MTKVWPKFSYRCQ